MKTGCTPVLGHPALVASKQAGGSRHGTQRVIACGGAGAAPALLPRPEGTAWNDVCPQPQPWPFIQWPCLKPCWACAAQGRAREARTWETGTEMVLTDWGRCGGGEGEGDEVGEGDVEGEGYEVGEGMWRGRG